jgi:hypothetical protein
MLARKGTRPKSEKTHLIEVQEHHSQQIREVLKKSERVTLLEVSYPDLVIQGPRSPGSPNSSRGASLPARR